MSADGHDQLFWSKELGKYVIITRGYREGLRTVLALTGTEKLRSIKDVWKATRDRAKEEALVRAGEYFTEPEIVLTGDKEAQPYSMPVLRLSEGYYAGVLSVANFDTGSAGAYRVNASLTWSRDGEHWRYMADGAPFIDNAPAFVLEKGNDYGMIYCAAPVVTNTEIQIFYAAIPELHYFNYEQIPEKMKKTLARKIPRAMAAKVVTRSTALNVATLSKDRYAGYFAEEGSVATAPLSLMGDTVRITADVTKEGSLTAALLDEQGRAIEGFGYEDFHTLTQSVTDAPLTWTKDTGCLVGRRVSLVLRLKQATVYTVSM